MKLRHLLPFLALPFLPNDSEAQLKVEANKNNLDVKSAYFDSSVNNPFGLTNFSNTKGDAQLKYKDNLLIYAKRNGVLNHLYGGNLSFGPFGFYYNRTIQSDRTENIVTQDSPIGEIRTETTIIDDRTSRDFGISLSYSGFSAIYESAVKEGKIDGNTLITIGGEDQDLISFSVGPDRNESKLYSLEFDNGFFRFIQNRRMTLRDEEESIEESFDNYLIGVRQSFGGEDGERFRLGIYYGQDVSNFPDFNKRYLSGFLGVNVHPDIDINLFYDGRDSSVTATLSTSDYSRLNQRDFERSLEDRFRIVPRIRDVGLETTRRYLEDMFFTGSDKPLSYNFTVDENEVKANLRLENILFHYSEGSWVVGLKKDFAIATYDFEQNSLSVGFFLGDNQNP